MLSYQSFSLILQNKKSIINVSKVTGHLFRIISRFKYHLALGIGALIVGVVDENSFMKRIEYHYQIEDLKAEILKYNDQYHSATQQLKDLKRNPKAIARVARERYFMKADNEDIFVLSDDEQATDNTTRYETTE